MTASVSLDAVPQVSRPAEVERAVREALELRTRLGEATEALAALEAELEDQQSRDVQKAAERLRAGSPAPAISPAIQKTATALESQRRQISALALAAGAAVDDLASTLQAHSTSWADELDRAEAEARSRATAALEVFERAAADVSAAASAAAWLEAANTDGDFGRRIPRAIVGTVATSSRTVSANGEPFPVTQLLGWLHEALSPPAPPQRITLGEPAALGDAA